MNFELDEQQRMLRSLVEQFVADHYDAPRRKGYQSGETGFSVENWRVFAEIGLLALPFSSGDGGLQGGSVEIATVMQVFGRGLVAEPFLTDVLLSGAILSRSTSCEVREQWLSRIIAGKARVALAHVEHAARFNIEHVEMQAVKHGDAFELHGAKTLVMAAVGVDAYIVSARLSEVPPTSAGIGLYLVSADSHGLGRRDYRLVDGSVASDVRFDAVRATTRLDITFDDFLHVINSVRLAACAEMLGIMSMLFDATLGYLKTRKQFGVPLGSFQVIQHRMADLYTVLEQSRSQLYRAMLTAESHSRYGETIVGAKSYISDRAIALSRDCIQLHGGIGVSDELIIGHGHKRILLLATLFGNADYELEKYSVLTRNQ